MKHAILAIIAAVLILMFASSVYPAADTALTFRLIATADGQDGEATKAGFQSPHWSHAHFGSNVYESSDGQTSSVKYLQLRTGDEANRYFDWTLEKAAKVIRQHDKLDRTGKVVGRRAEVLLKAGRGNCAVMWTNGATFREVVAQDLQHAAALEKQYGI